MLTTDEAFCKFKSRLELNDREQKNATKRHTEVREHIREKFEVDNDFLTGSYKRHTKTKPLNDIDIFVVLGDHEKHYRKKQPKIVLDDFYSALLDKYGDDAVRIQTRSVNIDFGVVVDSNDNTDYRVVSVDVVPAFSCNADFEIPDTDKNQWIKTNPKVHADKAIKAHQAYGNEWKGLVRMVKYWNINRKHGEKPVKPSFLIEVMALECLYGGWGGKFEYEIQSFLSTLADRIFDQWPDPAGLGPLVSDGMSQAQKERAKSLLLAASRDASHAIDHARKDRNGESLRVWRELFGPKFPLS